MFNKLRGFFGKLRFKSMPFCVFCPKQAPDALIFALSLVKERTQMGAFIAAFARRLCLVSSGCFYITTPYFFKPFINIIDRLAKLAVIDDAGKERPAFRTEHPWMKHTKTKKIFFCIAKV